MQSILNNRYGESNRYTGKKMKFDLTEKIAVVTGGGSGIGKAICTALSKQGAKVHIWDLDETLARNSADEINATKGHAIAHQCDVSNQAQVKSTIKKNLENESVDILINNAGVSHIGTVENTTEDEFDNIFNINVKGVYNCIHALIPHLKESRGVIINMASIASKVGIKDRFAYSMSKGAVLTMTYSVAKDYVEYGIRCNSISPARVHTPFVDGFIAKNYPGKEKETFEKLSKTQPMGRMGLPEEVADLAVYLCSDEASFITGTDFPIDGGFIKLNG